MQGVIDLWNCLLHIGVDAQSLHGIEERLDEFTGGKAPPCQ